MPFLVVIAKVISLNLIVENENCLGKDIFAESSNIDRKSPFMDPEDHETNMPQD